MTSWVQMKCYNPHEYNQVVVLVMQLATSSHQPQNLPLETVISLKS